MNEEHQKHRLKFAGKRRPSMMRRCKSHDYYEPHSYMITVTVEGRRPILGDLFFDNDKTSICLSDLGEAVQKVWLSIPEFHPEIEIIALQVMPDHLHCLLYVNKRLSTHLGNIVKGVKSSCNKAYKQIWGYTATPSRSAATLSTGTKSHAKHGLLWSGGYNDRIIYNDYQMQRTIAYIADNPRRLAVKRAHPDLFRVQRQLLIAGRVYSAQGNLLLLSRPLIVQVRCSRSIDEQEVSRTVRDMLLMAEMQGAVLISPCISQGEKAVMRAAFQAGYPLIVLQNKGFDEISKPSGQLFDACTRGQVLLLSPKVDFDNEHLKITRNQCEDLNACAYEIAHSDAMPRLEF